MVVLFPGTKDQGWRWQTSNNDYGKFYLSLSRETRGQTFSAMIFVPFTGDEIWRKVTPHGPLLIKIQALGARCRADGLHSECNRKCEQLARQLCELKSELDRLRVGSRCASPRDRDGCRDPPHHNGDCLFSEKARMPCDDMFHTTHDIEFNGGRRTEPQVLEDHLKADHPRLVRKVPPLNPAGVSCFDSVAEHGGAQRDSGHVKIHPTTATAHPHSGDGMEMYRRPESAGSGGYGGGEQIPPVAEYQHDSGGTTSPAGGRTHYHSEPIRKSPTPRFNTRKGGGDRGGGGDGGSREKILPPSQRYNFYRYYGFAGQGAKTSRGFHPKLKESN